MKSETRDIVHEGLKKGLTERIAKIYDVLSSAGEQDKLKRFQTGLDTAIKAYEKASEFIDKDSDE